MHMIYDSYQVRDKSIFFGLSKNLNIKSYVWTIMGFDGDRITKYYYIDKQKAYEFYEVYLDQLKMYELEITKDIKG